MDGIEHQYFVNWAKIFIHSGPGEGRHVVISDSEGVRVGRDRSTDFSVMDPLMSRCHFEIFCLDGRWQLRDLGSRNGTKLNDHPIQQASLKDGDIVEAGLTLFRINVDA